MPPEDIETNEETNEESEVTDEVAGAEDALLESMGMGRDDGGDEGAQPPSPPPAAGTPAAPPAAPPVDPEKQARIDFWKGKIADLTGRVADRKAQKELERVQQQQQQTQTQFQATQQQLDQLARIGVRPDMTPQQIHERITQAALAEQDPKHAIALLRSEMSEMKSGYEGAIKELKQQLESQATAGSKQAAEKIFLDTVKDPKYEVLLDFYDEAELVHIGHQMADMLTATEGGYTIQRIADKILEEITQRETRREERKKSRSATSQQGSQTAQTGSGPQGSSAQASVLSPATSARKESGERRSTRKERLAAAEQQIGPLLDSMVEPSSKPAKASRRK